MKCNCTSVFVASTHILQILYLTGVAFVCPSGELFRVVFSVFAFPKGQLLHNANEKSKTVLSLSLFKRLNRFNFNLSCFVIKLNYTPGTRTTNFTGEKNNCTMYHKQKILPTAFKNSLYGIPGVLPILKINSV